MKLPLAHIDEGSKLSIVSGMVGGINYAANDKRVSTSMKTMFITIWRNSSFPMA